MSTSNTGISIAELHEAAKKVVVTEADIDALLERLNEADKKFEAESQAMTADQEFLQYQYTI